MLSEEDIDSLNDTARNFFRFILAFGIKLKHQNFVNLLVVYFGFILTITCSALTKTVKYRIMQNLQKRQSKHY